MSIIIIDGAKLRKIKKIEEFLGRAYDKSQESSPTPSSSYALPNPSKEPKIETLTKIDKNIQNSPQTFEILKQELKKEAYFEALIVDTKKQTAETKILPVDTIIKK